MTTKQAHFCNFKCLYIFTRGCFLINLKGAFIYEIVSWCSSVHDICISQNRFFKIILEAKMVRWLVQSTKANISSCCVKMPFTLNILDLLGDLWNWTDQNPDVSKKPIKELIVKAKKVSWYVGNLLGLSATCRSWLMSKVSNQNVPAHLWQLSISCVVSMVPNSTL